MTENKAIQALKLEGAIEIIGKGKRVAEFFAGLDMAITALKEIQQYREIGTVEECRKAAEKQKPKKPDYEGDGYADRQIVYNTWICPNCGKRYEVDYDDYDYCPNCGQAIYTENLEGIENECNQ